jgi:hypothetical protein
MAPQPPSPREDLVDAIARLLKPEQRAYFYERMRHFRQLRPDDELLRVVEAMGWLALVIGEAPRAVARERAQIAEVLQTGLAHLDAVVAAGQTSREQIEARLGRLPQDLAHEIDPAAIARALVESLRQQFVQSGLPATAEALGAVTQQVTEAIAPLYQVANHLRIATGAAEQARVAVDRMTASLTQVTDTATAALTTVSERFRVECVRAVWVVGASACVVGVLLGLIAERMWITQRGWAPPALASSAPTVSQPKPTGPALAASTPERHARSTNATTPTPRREPARGTAVEQRSNTDGTAARGDDTTP